MRRLSSESLFSLLNLSAYMHLPVLRYGTLVSSDTVITVLYYSMAVMHVTIAEAGPRGHFVPERAYDVEPPHCIVPKTKQCSLLYIIFHLESYF